MVSLRWQGRIRRRWPAATWRNRLVVADIVLIGAVRRGKALLRSGARAGDLLYVTGALGGSAAGLARMAELAANREGANQARPRIPSRLQSLLAPHLSPQPRIAQGLWLARRGLASAAIDLSDGLSTDLAHLCQDVPLCRRSRRDGITLHSGATIEQALHGGEDYELLFTAWPGARVPRRIAGIPITRIGRMVRQRKGRPAVTIITADGSQALAPRGWEHFS